MQVKERWMNSSRLKGYRTQIPKIVREKPYCRALTYLINLISLHSFTNCVLAFLPFQQFLGNHRAFVFTVHGDWYTPPPDIHRIWSHSSCFYSRKLSLTTLPKWALSISSIFYSHALYLPWPTCFIIWHYLSIYLFTYFQFLPDYIKLHLRMGKLSMSFMTVLIVPTTMPG